MLLDAVVLLVPVAALAGAVLPDGDAIALEEVVGAHLLGTVVPLVLVAALARAILPDGFDVIELEQMVRALLRRAVFSRVLTAESAVPPIVQSTTRSFAIVPGAEMGGVPVASTAMAAFKLRTWDDSFYALRRGASRRKFRGAYLAISFFLRPDCADAHQVRNLRTRIFVAAD
jgi:hypothetical protein